MLLASTKECDFPALKVSFTTCIRVFLAGSSQEGGALQRFYAGHEVRDALVQIIHINFDGWLRCLLELALRLNTHEEGKTPGALLSFFLDKMFRRCPHGHLNLVDV